MLYFEIKGVKCPTPEPDNFKEEEDINVPKLKMEEAGDLPDPHMGSKMDEINAPDASQTPLKFNHDITTDIKE